MNNILNIVLLCTAIVIVAGLVILILMATQKGERQLNRSEFRSKWLKIEQDLVKREQASYQLVILESDKLLDNALKQRGIAGQTMGERMKSFQARWSNANLVWSAHKLRNQIAHESGFQPSYDDARRALNGFKQALKDVGAI